MAFGLASPAELASACFVKVLQIAFTSCRSQKLVAFTISNLADQKQSPFHFFPSSPFSNPALSTPPFWAPAGTVEEFTCGKRAFERAHKSGRNEP